MEILRAQELKKYYGEGDSLVKALDGVDLSVEQGEFVAVVGSSGSGKSTFLHMLGGLDVPDSGSVCVAGHELSKLSENELAIFRRRKIGFVFQDYNLLPLTARGMECDMIGGLDAGADDYIVKPVSLRVLTARIQALLRRTSNRENIYRMGSFEFVFEEASFRKHGVLLRLSVREQKLLAYLVAHANLVLSRDKILAHLWMDDPDSVEENAVAVVIRRLREKLEDDPARPVYIRNVYGAGYMWSEEKK